MARWAAFMAAAVAALFLAHFTGPSSRPEDASAARWRPLVRSLEAQPGTVVLMFGEHALPAIAEVLPQSDAGRRMGGPPPFDMKGPNRRPRQWELCDLGCAKGALADAEAAHGGLSATLVLLAWIAVGALALVLAWRAGLGLGPGAVVGTTLLLLAADAALNLHAPPSAARVLGSACALAFALSASALLRRRPVELEGA